MGNIDNLTLKGAFERARHLLNIKNIGIGVNATLDLEPSNKNMSLLVTAFTALTKSKIFSRFSATVRSVPTGVNSGEELKVTLTDKK